MMLYIIHSYNAACDQIYYVSDIVKYLVEVCRKYYTWCSVMTSMARISQETIKLFAVGSKIGESLIQTNQQCILIIITIWTR